MLQETSKATRQDPYAEANAGKIEPVSFRITFTENQRQDWPEVKTWEEINVQLYQIAADERAKRYGGAAKTDVLITFADGRTHTSSPEVSSRHPFETLQKHLRRAVGYLSGLIKPAQLTNEDFKGHMNAYGLETEAAFYFLAREYAVGVVTPEDPTPYKVYTIDPNGGGSLELATMSREEAHNRRRELVEETANTTVMSAEVWRDGEQDPDPSSEDPEPVKVTPEDLYLIRETKPPEVPSPVRSMIVAEHATQESAEEDIKTWRQANPFLIYGIEQDGRYVIETGTGEASTLAADVLAFLQFVEEATPNGDIKREATELAERVRKGELKRS